MQRTTSGCSLGRVAREPLDRRTPRRSTSDTNKDAENPRSRAATPPATRQPGPWIIWQEEGPTKDQIFVVKPIGPGTTVCPPGTKPSGGAPGGGFCWQQVGVERSPIGVPSEPSLDVDPSRPGIEPDIAFTGPNDSVPWAVWYEIEPGRLGSATSVSSRLRQ